MEITYFISLFAPYGNVSYDVTRQGSISQRLMQMSGLTTEEFTLRARPMSLLGQNTLPPNGMEMAARLAKRLNYLNDGRQIVFLGHEIAAAFGHIETPFVWERSKVMIPSPLDPWYANTTHMAATTLFLEDLFA